MGERKKRFLKRELNKRGIFWKREPSWGQIAHDLDVVDIHLSFERAISEIPQLELAKVITETVFRSKPDQVLINGETRGIIPDLFLLIEDKSLLNAGNESYKARLLFEYDRTSYDNPSFRNEKVIPYAEYIYSQAFKKRFGYNAGHWLVIAKGEKRMGYLLRDVKEAVPDYAGLFFFSTFNKVVNQNPLTSPIWMDIESTRFEPLLENLAQTGLIYSPHLNKSE